jgi:RNA ligase (TIGR02306 family)
MRVAEISNNKIEVKERENLTLGDKTGAIVKVIGCGLCGSDIVKFKEHISKDGTVLGHEIVAEIVEINSNSGFKVGDTVIYFEIDSLLPEIQAFEWLKGSSWSQKLRKYRISTHKFRDQISQGLVIPINDLKTIYNQVIEKTSGVVGNIDYPSCIENPKIGEDLTEILSVEKYDPPVTVGELGEIIRHEWYVPKTDEERIQLCAEEVLPKYINSERGDRYSAIKLDGTSCTPGLFEDGYLVGGCN